MGRVRQSGGRLALIGSVCLLALACPSRAQDSSGRMQFWLPATPQLEAVPSLRPPALRPRRPSSSNAASRRLTSSPARPATQAGFVVAVFGDAFAYDAARGLADAYESDPRTGVYDATDEAGGLAQDATPAWADAVDIAIRKAGRVDAAVMMLGSGDLKPLADEHGDKVDVGSPGWQQAYGERVERAAAAFRAKHLPLIWVGLPMVRDADLASRYADLNAVVREHAPKAGAVFVDTWEGFTNEAGQYDPTGPDANGQTTKLRRNDGLRFTRAGARKLASFIEPDLKREHDRVQSNRQIAAISVENRSLFDQALDVDVNALIRREAGLPPLPATQGTSVRSREGPVVELTAAPVSRDGRLATFTGPASAGEIQLARGLAPPARAGRTDDFSWPRR